MTSTLSTGFDFTDPDLNMARIPHDEFAALRRSQPIFWVEQAPEARAGMSDASGSGYWAVTKHADILTVSKNSQIFSSRENGVIIRLPETATRESVEQTQVVIINQDAPEHTQLRSIISRGFTPRAIGVLEEALEERARRIVREAVAAGSGNFVDQVASQFPLEVIGDMLGVPAEDRQKIFDWTNQMTGAEDADLAREDNDPNAAALEVLMYSMGLAADRRENPRDDIVTKLVNADVDGRGLTDDEFGFFVIALAVAGNETTRNATTHGMNAFFDHPDQWELWVKERPEHDGRRSDPLGDAGHLVPAHGSGGHRTRWRRDQGRTAGRVVLRQCQSRRRRLHGSARVQRPARSEPAPGVRWSRRPLLHRRQPRAHRDPDDL